MKAVIFDLDNTLIDFVDRKKKVIEYCVKEMIKAGLKENYKTLHKEFSDFYWKNGIEDQKILQKFLKQKYGKIDYKVLASAVLKYREVNTRLLKPYPGVKKLLSQLKKMNLKLAILSDAPRMGVYQRLIALNLIEYFDLILSKDDVKRLKPNTRGFVMATKKLKVKPNECIMVGDRNEKDVLGAKKLGMITIFAKYGNPNQKDNEAHFVANKPEELSSIIKKLN